MWLIRTIIIMITVAGGGRFRGSPGLMSAPAYPGSSSSSPYFPQPSAQPPPFPYSAYGWELADWSLCLTFFFINVTNVIF